MPGETVPKIMSAHALAIFWLLPFVAAQDRSWMTVAPGGDTACGYGSEFRFHFRPGAPDTTGLVIDFQGGGACWSAATCALPIWLPTASGPPGAGGLASTTNEANPVRDYNCELLAK